MPLSSYWVEPDMNDDISHYGVKGMKWGVRKDRYKSMSRSERKTQRQKYRSSKPTYSNVRNAYRKAYDSSFKKRMRGINDEMDTFNKKHPDYDTDDGGGLNKKDYDQWNRLSTEYVRVAEASKKPSRIEARNAVDKQFGSGAVNRALRRGDVLNAMRNYVLMNVGANVATKLTGDPTLGLIGSAASTVYAGYKVYDILATNYEKKLR